MTVLGKKLWSVVAVSDFGNSLLAVSSGGILNYSIDGGTTWSSQTFTDGKYLKAIVMTEDTGFLAAVKSGISGFFSCE